ncbi:hypothetical protein QBC47DRAFT_366723 [Echria macrotheca]|uniref:Uncharacterized protein n=1 Tax=Echria macrotheca TaxID=438768 RepID=A0AAJ0BN30_9PEZI|nr:hypothetical protein QBC47DRAFT_366723 [Echria macrotheca]
MKDQLMPDWLIIGGGLFYGTISLFLIIATMIEIAHEPSDDGAMCCLRVFGGLFGGLVWPLWPLYFFVRKYCCAPGYTVCGIDVYAKFHHLKTRSRRHKQADPEAGISKNEEETGLVSQPPTPEAAMELPQLPPYSPVNPNNP